MAEIHTQVDADPETWNQVNEALRRMAEQHRLLVQVHGPNLEKLVAGLAHQQFTAQLIIKSVGLEQLQQPIAEMALVSKGFETQLSNIAQTIAQSLSKLAVPALDWMQLAEAMQVSSAIANLVQPATIINAELVQQIQSISQGLDDAVRAATANLAAVDVARRMFEQLEVFKNLHELIEEEETAAEAFHAAGWPIAPSMPKTLIRRVVKLHQEGKSRYVSQAIIGYYRRNNYSPLVEVVQRWRNHPLFALRTHIIEDALWAHRQGKYTLSVPALIAQVEGIMNDYVVANGLPVRLGKIKEVYEAVLGDSMDYDFSTWAIVETLLYQLRTNTYLPTPFEDELARPVRRRRSTRHTILHGIMPGYNRESHSLRAFLLLDALSALQQFEPLREGES
jgi:hypothetical protein